MLIVCVAIFLSLTGCDKVTTVEPIATEQNPRSGNVQAGLIEDPTNLLAGTLEFITLPQSLLGQVGVDTRSSGAYVKASRGGKVYLEYSYLSILGTVVYVQASLDVPAYALRTDTYIWVTLADGRLDFNFGPDGLRFGKTATLDVKVRGLSVNNLLNGRPVYFQWWDPKSSAWQKMPASYIRSSTLLGTFTCEDAQISHFSRYGFGR